MAIAETWGIDNSTFREYCGDMLRTIDEVLVALGGPAKVAELCGVGASAVSNWKARGRIAADKLLIVSDALRSLGKTVDPAVFGMAPAARPEEVRA